MLVVSDARAMCYPDICCTDQCCVYLRPVLVSILLEEGPDFVGRDLVYNVYWSCEHRTKFVYYFPWGHNLIPSATITGCE